MGPTAAAADTARCSSACSWHRPAQRQARLEERRRRLLLRPTSTWCGRKRTLPVAAGTRDTTDDEAKSKTDDAGAQRQGSRSRNGRPTTRTKKRSYCGTGMLAITASETLQIPSRTSCWEFRPSGSGPPRGGGSPSSPPSWRRARPHQLQRRQQRGLHVLVRHLLPVIVPPGIPPTGTIDRQGSSRSKVQAAGGFYEFPAVSPFARTTITPGVAILPASTSETITTITTKTIIGPTPTQRPPSKPSSIPAPRLPSCPPRRPRGPDCSTCWTGATRDGPPASVRAASWAVSPPDVPPSSWAKRRREVTAWSPCPVPRSPSWKGMA